MPSRELNVLVRTIVIQAKAGGALVSALQDIAIALEDRKQLHREVHTAFLRQHSVDTSCPFSA